MANNLSILDSTGTARTVKSTDTTDVHTPHHNIDSMPGTAAEGAALPSSFVVIAGDDGTDTQAVQLSAGGDLKITLDSEEVEVTLNSEVVETTDGGPSWTSKIGVSSAAVTSADATTATAVTDAPTSGEKIVITDIMFSSDTALSLEFEEETSGTIIYKVYLPANGAGQFTPRGKVKLATADKKLMVQASAAGNVAVTVGYFSEA